MSTDILFICTGNICRSPVAEALLRHRTAALGLDVRVHSAGVLESGRPASASSVELLAGRGLDLAGHRSTEITAELLETADLALGMAREHVRHAAVLVPAAWPRTFTLKALVRQGEKVGPRPAGEELSAWLARVHEGRVPSDLLGSSAEDDVADPIGRPMPAYRRMVGEVEDLVDRLVTLIWPAEVDRLGR
ncbi:MAG: low molecular weight protein arginine phosphatase [Acidimicrobiales bacterium]